MQFAQPLWLIAGLAAVAFLIWRYRQYDRRQRTALATFAAPHLVERLTRSVSAGRRKLKRALVLTAIAGLFLALARPQAGYRWEETRRKGLDILFAVDTSKSMRAQDVKPDRLTRAKLAVSDLLDRLDGDGVGLIAFAGSAFLQSPVTLDYEAFRESLNALDTSIIPRGSTDLASAIREAQAAFGAQTDHDKILVLLTDGEDLAGNAVRAAEAAAKNGVKIFTVGVGCTSGELIPITTEAGGTEFAKDASGQIVKSRLDETTLKKIASATGGMYQPLGQQGEGLKAIYQQGLASFTRHDLASRQHRVYREQFQWPLLAALLAFVAEMLVGTRQRQRRGVRIPGGKPSNRLVLGHPKPAAAAALGLMAFAWTGVGQASPQSAERAYQKGDFTAALKQYQTAAARNPDQAELQFNLGSAAYKAAAFDQAHAAFQKSLRTDQVKLQADAYYNLGNTQYRQGQKTEKTNPQQTIQTWQQAIQSYESALQIKPGDANARYNRDLVKKKLEPLQKQQQQPQQKNQKDDKQKKPDQNDPKQKDPNQKGNDSKNQEQKDQKNQDPNNQNPKSNAGSDPKNPKPDQTPPNPKDSGGSPKSDPNAKNEKEPSPNPNSQGQDQPPKRPDQKQPQAGNPPPPAKPEAGPDPKNQPAQSGQQPQPAGSDPAKGQPGKDGPAASGEDHQAPGEMTREEARSLLDSLKNDARRLPVAPLSRNEFKDRDDQLQKDW